MKCYSIGIIGGADGPTAIFMSSKISPALIVGIAAVVLIAVCIVIINRGKVETDSKSGFVKVYRMKKLTALSQCNTRLSHLQCLSGNQLKMIAAICMLVDHVTKVFFASAAYKIINPMLAAGQISPEQLNLMHWFYDHVLCGIGAIAFPVFAFAFAEGFSHTHSKKRYLLRLAIFALISEFPFDATFYGRYHEGTQGWPWYWYHQNVFFTYLQALCALWLMEQANRIKSKPLSVLLQGIIVFIACYVAQFVVYGDYRGYGVFLIIVAYLLRRNRVYQILGMILAKVVFDRSYYPISFLISLILILLYNGKRGEKNLKPFFYGFYPIHIAIIGFLDWLIFTVLWGSIIPG